MKSCAFNRAGTTTKGARGENPLIDPMLFCVGCWATRKREPYKAVRLKWVNPVLVEAGMESCRGGARKGATIATVWAAEVVVRQQGSEGKPGRPGTRWGNLMGSLDSLST